MTGFLQTEAAPTAVCGHRDSTEIAEILAFAMRRCTACGRCWILVQLDDEALAWEAVAEPEETEDVAGMGKKVLVVQDTEEHGGVQPEPGETGRDGQPVPRVPQPRQRKPRAKTREEEVA